MRVAINDRKGQEKLLYIYRVLRQTTYVRPSVPWKALDFLSRQSSGSDEAQLTFIVCTTGFKSLWESRQVLGKPTFWQFLAINPWKKFAPSTLASKPTVVHLLLLPFNTDVNHHFEARWTLDNSEIFYFFQRVFGHNFVEKSEHFRLKTECNWRFISHRLTRIGMPYIGY